MQKSNRNIGVVISLVVIAAWLGLLTFLLTYGIDWTSPVPYLLALLQTHLYTGLFITAHDAMHGVVAPGRKELNRGIGTVAALLFAYNWYPRLLPRHHLHHRHVATDQAAITTREITTPIFLLLFCI